MLNLNKGFTLIELVVVISILAILAALAVPKLFTIVSDAQAATVAGVAGALSASSAENYAVRTEKSTNGSKVANCTDVGSLLIGGSVPTGYTIRALSVAAGTTSTCTLTGPGTQTSTFLATGIT